MFAYHDIFLSENGPPTATAKHIKLLIYNIFIHSVSENKQKKPAIEPASRTSALSGHKLPLMLLWPVHWRSA